MDEMVGKRNSAQAALLWAGSIGPLGHLPASGTVTVAVVGLPAYWLMHAWPWPGYLTVTVCFAAAAVWVHQVGDRILGTKDSRRLVWDELVGFMIAAAFVPWTWQLAVLLLFLERLIDIIKVPPADYIERNWPGGWGVVGDDAVAGLYTCLLVQLMISFKPFAAWVGL